MNAAKNFISALIVKITQFFQGLMSYLPRKLPVGVDEFHAWANRIIAQSEKFATEESKKFVLATALINLDVQKGRAVADRFFMNLLHVAATKQVAGAMFQEIKANQKARIDSEKSQAAEVTSAPPATQESTKAPVNATVPQTPAT